MNLEQKVREILKNTIAYSKLMGIVGINDATAEIMELVKPLEKYGKEMFDLAQQRIDADIAGIYRGAGVAELKDEVARLRKALERIGDMPLPVCKCAEYIETCRSCRIRMIIDQALKGEDNGTNKT